jgi:hypothetical protein
VRPVGVVVVRLDLPWAYENRHRGVSYNVKWG